MPRPGPRYTAAVTTRCQGSPATRSLLTSPRGPTLMARQAGGRPGATTWPRSPPPARAAAGPQAGCAAGSAAGCSAADRNAVKPEPRPRPASGGGDAASHRWGSASARPKRAAVTPGVPVTAAVLTSSAGHLGKVWRGGQRVRRRRPAYQDQIFDNAIAAVARRTGRTTTDAEDAPPGSGGGGVGGDARRAAGGSGCHRKALVGAWLPGAVVVALLTGAGVQMERMAPPSMGIIAPVM